jgi:hypothetical protein
MRLAATVERDRDVQPFALGPERVVCAVVPGAAVDAAGREEDGAEAELLDGPSRLDDGGRNVVRRHHRGAEEAIRALRAEVAQPVVVGARDRRRQLGLEPVEPDDLRRVEPEDEEAAAGKEDGHVQTFRVHGVALRGRVPAALLRGRVHPVLLGAPGRAAVAAERPRRPEPQHDVRLDLDPHVATELRQTDRRHVPPRRVDVALPEVRRLEDVHVAVRDAQALVRHAPP